MDMVGICGNIFLTKYVTQWELMGYTQACDRTYSVKHVVWSVMIPQGNDAHGWWLGLA